MNEVDLPGLSLRCYNILEHANVPVLYYFLVWDDENERHIHEHGVRMREFEEVVCNPDALEKSRSTGRPIAFGYTSTGKYLARIYDVLDESTVYPVTAYPVD